MKYIIFCILLAILSGGCDTWLDNEMPKHNLIAENAITNERTAETALNGIYSFLHGFGALSAYYISDNEFRCGLLYDQYNGTFEVEDLSMLRQREEETRIYTPWFQMYQMINAANNFIYNVEKLPEDVFAAGRKEELLAEARCMRGFALGFLLRRYGYFWDLNSDLGIPLRLEPASLSNNFMGRSSVKECYKQIFEDFDYAIQFGPRYYSKFRTCATTAKAFKADLLLSRGETADYEEVVRLCDEILASDEFQLEKTYGDIFSRGYNSTELMFTRHIKTLPELDDNNPSLLRLFGTGIYKPSDMFLEIFNKEDARFAFTLDTVKIMHGISEVEKEAWVKHYVADGNCPMYYMRLGQVLLMKAEAMARLSYPIKDILVPLNTLRERAGNLPLHEENYWDHSDLLLEIFNENVKELSMENGAIYFLAIRIKSGNVRKLKELNPYYEDDSQLCFPIPKMELDFNPNVVQKPL